MLHTYSECHKWHCEQQKTTEINRIIDLTQRTTLSPGYNNSRVYQFSLCPYKGGEKTMEGSTTKEMTNLQQNTQSFGNTQTRETSWAENMALACNHQVRIWQSHILLNLPLHHLFSSWGIFSEPHSYIEMDCTPKFYWAFTSAKRCNQTEAHTFGSVLGLPPSQFVCEQAKDIMKTFQEDHQKQSVCCWYTQQHCCFFFNLCFQFSHLQYITSHLFCSWLTWRTA
jgi:hypothetical protein